MFLFKSHKKFTHKQTSIIGFVLAVMSILLTAIMVYGFPFVGAWLNTNGVFHLDAFLLMFVTVIFLSVQALLLFGFPLYYARDKKSHMTGFQILLYALMWMFLMVGLILVLTVAMTDNTQPEFDLNDFLLELEDMEGGGDFDLEGLELEQ